MNDPFLVIGSVIAGKYRVDRVIGEGGFGVVYAGAHLLIGQAVAIKLMKPLGGPEEQTRGAEALLREARVLFDLAHPSIVRLYDVGTTPTRLGDVPYVVLELIDGPSLADEVRRRQQGQASPFSAPEIFAIFDAVLDGLSVAHARGVVHRDLKPSNVMLVPGGAKILDFGTARLGTPTRSVGSTGFTPLYAAPEQWDGRAGASGPATDVFAVGLLLAEAALLTPALAGDGMAQIIGAALDATRRPSIVARRPDLPRDLEALFLTATRPSVAERFRDAAQMRMALRAAFGAPALAAPLALTFEPRIDASPRSPYAASPQATPALMSAAAPPPAIPPNAYTTNAPVHRPATMPTQSPRSGPHVVSVLALVASLCAIGAILAFAVVLVFYLRQSADEPQPAAAAPIPSAHASAAPANPSSTSAPPAPGPTHAPAAVDAGGGGGGGGKPANEPTIIIGTAMTNYYDSDELKAIANAHKGEVRMCVAKAMSKNPKLSGNATVTISNTLGATNCDFNDHSEDAVAVEMCQCLKVVMSGWKYPPAKNQWKAALFQYVLHVSP